MRTLVIGIDSGTQSTKALVLDVEKRKVIGTGTSKYGLIPGLPPGAKEQHPDTWRTAVIKAVKQAVRAAKAKPAEIKALGVSGQQHGFVALDKNGQVIRPAKLWCDTVTAPECEEIMEAIGGFDATIAALGNPVLPGYTASKILWLKKHEPDNYARLATVLLPHDFINWWLTGRAVMEYGDASGTALLDVRTKQWCQTAINAIDPHLADKLPPLIPSDQPVGTLQPAAAKALGLTREVLVSAGGGDNMMAAIGTGNTRPGVV
ncbi:MAG: FGGY family carbohydrate kinase, partial [Verrucomicrobiae bacterium]|nr:FGGY family carbohydrate kinase [Verrucomicrobiae bacterium]